MHQRHTQKRKLSPERQNVVTKMRLLVVAAALALCGVGLNSSLDPQTLVLDVQIGANVTISCSNYTKNFSQISWFRVNQQLNRIGHMFRAGEPATLQNGFSKDKFEISSNLTTVFLKINQVNPSDAGFYFCLYHNNGPASVLMNSTHLKVKDQLIIKSFQITYSTMILGGLIILLLIVIFGLAVKIKKLQGAGAEEQDACQSEEQTQDRDVTYSSVFLRPKNKPVQRPPSGLDHVVYSNIREKVEAEAAPGDL